MQLVIDVLLIAVFGLLVFCGWWRGFMKSILGLGRLVLSLVITILFGSAFAGWIDETFINPPVFEAVSKKFSSIAAEVTASAEGGIDALVEKIPEAFRGYLDLTTVDPTAEINALVEQWSRTVADGISRVISLILGFVLLFVISFIISMHSCISCRKNSGGAIKSSYRKSRIIANSNISRACRRSRLY
jgi:uncharacterized membrane protein required for colicin V production